MPDLLENQIPVPRSSATVPSLSGRKTRIKYNFCQTAERLMCCSENKSRMEKMNEQHVSGFQISFLEMNESFCLPSSIFWWTLPSTFHCSQLFNMFQYENLVITKHIIDVTRALTHSEIHVPSYWLALLGYCFSVKHSIMLAVDSVLVSWTYELLILVEHYIKEKVDGSPPRTSLVQVQ